jgi:hypothetical protein
VIDLLHPLATIHWEEWLKSLPLKTCTDRSQYILFKSKPYRFTNDGILMYECDSDSWAKVKLPTKGSYGISTYRSQLVLVGGLDPTTQQATNKVWVSDDGRKWEPSLPPLPIASGNPLVVNTGSPECLIVIGGQIVENCIDVHVLMCEQWMPAQPLPLYRVLVNSSRNDDLRGYTILNRNLLVLKSLRPSICCNLDALLATVSSGFLKETSCSFKSVWRRFDIPGCGFNLLCLENCVTIVGASSNFYSCGTAMQHLYRFPLPLKIYAYSPSTQNWIQVGDIPHSYPCCSLAHGSLLSLRGELVVQKDFERRTLKASSVKSKQIYLSYVFYFYTIGGKGCLDGHVNL